GERSARRLAEVVRTQVEIEPRAQLEYVSISDAETMERLDKLPDDRPTLIAIAVRIGRTRLIDNIQVLPARQKTRATVEA
ncbi:MAG: pantoate--beta-alanine ligase, partial [Acidobacteriota bacterium]|nr:pantoate--beta-alanine ligase [Acidobacteriota bacterium]